MGVVPRSLHASREARAYTIHLCCQLVSGLKLFTSQERVACVQRIDALTVGRRMGRLDSSRQVASRRALPLARCRLVRELLPPSSRGDSRSLRCSAVFAMNV